MEPAVDHETRRSELFSVTLKLLKPLIQRRTLPFLSIASTATPGRFQLIDYDQFLSHNSLTDYKFYTFLVLETADVDILYIW